MLPISSYLHFSYSLKAMSHDDSAKSASFVLPTLYRLVHARVLSDIINYIGRPAGHIYMNIGSSSTYFLVWIALLIPKIPGLADRLSTRKPQS